MHAPEIWSGKTLDDFEKKLILSDYITIDIQYGICSLDPHTNIRITNIDNTAIKLIKVIETAKRKPRMLIIVDE